MRNRGLTKHKIIIIRSTPKSRNEVIYLIKEYFSNTRRIFEELRWKLYSLLIKVPSKYILSQLSPSDLLTLGLSKAAMKNQMFQSVSSDEHASSGLTLLTR